jgi:hypothetical protein
MIVLPPSHLYSCEVLKIIPLLGGSCHPLGARDSVFKPRLFKLLGPGLVDSGMMNTFCFRVDRSIPRILNSSCVDGSPGFEYEGMPE